MSKRRRYVRFSLVTLLVFMTGVAVFVNHEVQRAKAIEETVNRIEGWKGILIFKPRANMPAFLSNVLPQFWTQEIDQVLVTLYSKEWPEPSKFQIKAMREPAVIDPSQLENLLELGALDNLSTATLIGSAIKGEAVARICRSSSIESCLMHDVWLSNEEIEDLRRAYPDSNLLGMPHLGITK